MQRIRIAAGMLATTATLLALPALASGAVLYDQTDQAGTPTTNPDAGNFAPSNAFADGGDRTADDFTVPGGEEWSVDGVIVDGAYNGSSPTLRVNVFVYADAGGEPGEALFSRTSVNAANGPDYVIALPGGPTLAAGTYWLTVQQVNPDGAFWSWTTRVAQTGNPAQHITAGPAACDPLVWHRRLDCWPGTNPDQVFRLTGTKRDVGAPSVEITKGAPRKTEKSKVKFKFESNEAGSTFECKKDKKPWKPCTSPTKMKRLDVGKHKFKVRATDAAGNTGKAAKDKFKVV